MKTNKELEVEFWKFLRKKGLTRKFKKNVKDAIEHNNYGNKFKSTLSKNCVEAVNYGFTWSKTTESHKFWDEIDDEWKRYVFKLDGGIAICGYPVHFDRTTETIKVGCYNVNWKDVKRIYSQILELKK